MAYTKDSLQLANPLGPSSPVRALSDGRPTVLSESGRTLDSIDKDRAPALALVTVRTVHNSCGVGAVERNACVQSERLLKL